MLKIEVIPCLEDNYAYLIINDKNHAVVVDAPEAGPIVDKVKELGVKVEAVLLTHHHSDHVQGVSDLKLLGSIPVFGPKAESSKIIHCDLWLAPEEKFTISKMKFKVIKAHGHTKGHVSYSLPEANALFTGDSLMFWGCGRIFEGTHEDMWETLEGFMKFDPKTLIYSGHNYGEVNGQFAISLGGYLDRMNARLENVRQLNSENLPVCPASLQEEMETNPFLLAVDDHYAAEIGMKDQTPFERFRSIRQMRDKF